MINMKNVVKYIIPIIVVAIITFICCLIFLNPNKKIRIFESYVDVIEEKVNWYVEFDKNDNYIMCDNKNFDNKNGICEVGTYKIIDGDYFEKNTTIELYLDHYYKDGKYIVADIIGPRNVNLERMEKYKYSRVFIDEQTNEIFNVSSISLDKLNYDY